MNQVIQVNDWCCSLVIPLLVSFWFNENLTRRLYRRHLGRHAYLAAILGRLILLQTPTLPIHLFQDQSLDLRPRLLLMPKQRQRCSDAPDLRQSHTAHRLHHAVPEA